MMEVYNGKILPQEPDGLTPIKEFDGQDFVYISNNEYVNKLYFIKEPNAKIKINSIRELRDYLLKTIPKSQAGYKVINYKAQYRKLHETDIRRPVILQVILLSNGAIMPIFFGFFNYVSYCAQMGLYEPKRKIITIKDAIKAGEEVPGIEIQRGEALVIR